MGPMDKVYYFLWAKKTHKLKSEISQILQSHYIPSGNVQVILLKFKMANTVDFLNICDRKNAYLIYGEGWYRTSGLLLIVYLFSVAAILNLCKSDYYWKCFIRYADLHFS